MTTHVGPLLPGGIHIGGVKQYTNVPIGDVPYAFLGNETSAAFGTGTTWSWVTSIFIPKRVMVSRLGYLVGSVGTFGVVQLLMYNYRGNAAIGLTTAGGQVVGAANTIQMITCNTPFNVQGPGVFWVAAAFSDSRSRVKVMPTSTNVGPLTQNILGTWNGTTFTVPLPSTGGVPTAFIPDTGPYVVVQEE